MSEFHVEVAEVKNVYKHPNADSLSVGEVNGYPVIFRTTDVHEGQKVVHIPIDSIVPDTVDWAFLAGHLRIKAKRLRGVFSMGLVVPAKDEWVVGQNVQEEFGIKKWEPPIGGTLGGDNATDTGVMCTYTDIEGFRRYPNVLVDGEEVCLTEKIHGTNFRAVWHDNELIVGSHHMVKKTTGNLSIWARVAIRDRLDEKLFNFPDIVIYGEIFGPVQDLKYGKSTAELVLFDAMDLKIHKYLDYDDFLSLARQLDIPTVPLLYRGPWNKGLLSLSEGKSTYPGADNVREGFVVKPVKERYDKGIGRVILKMVGEGYLLRKESKVPASCNHLEHYSEPSSK